MGERPYPAKPQSGLTAALSRIEWHDLPLERLTFTPTSIELEVTPFDEDTQDDDRWILVLSDFDNFKCDIVDSYDKADSLFGFEIHSFDFVEADDQCITGKIIIFTTKAKGWYGVWIIRFDRARWHLRSCKND